MNLRNNTLGGVIFLIVSLLYGYHSSQIAMLPGDEFAPFNAQTLPYYLSLIGAFLSVVMILRSLKSSPERISIKKRHLKTFSMLIFLMAAFAFAIDWIGFFLATNLFLIGGFLIMGERRIKVILISSLPFSLFIWFSLSELLGIYLAPGKLFLNAFSGVN